MITSLIFDLDGVVINSEPLWDRSQIEFLGRRGVIYDPGMKHLITGKSVVEGVRIMQQLHDFGGDAELLALERKGLVGELFASELEFVEGFEDFFERHSATHKVCLATALDRELVAIANKRLDLTSFFGKNIFTIADVGMKSKPNPDVFLHAAKELNAHPDECIVFEDAPYGIEAAHRARMKCVAITTTYSREMLLGADVVVSGFKEINLNELK